ncbi:3D domain-containing protein [Tamlana sp. 62-3]|uniref:3D domain-containing protein n=1 Tax=Neotamlana sargassicola TaxID=2883125 RepID=A0A9X1L7E4_9FLAO|nr:3D domain-containing protein [Tamlana sargassicola]MCB4808444.1 3D domain-containing protein [Tamlana sargassicola]
MKKLCFILLIVLFSCEDHKTKTSTFEDGFSWNSALVTATAYNSLKYQTSSNPNITAFGDSLKPGLKYIAVSRDLLSRGLKHNTPVKIEGLTGVYLVKDKMHSRWRNRIDIYMGVNVDSALQWGKKRVCIDYGLPKNQE